MASGHSSCVMSRERPRQPRTAPPQPGHHSPRPLAAASAFTSACSWAMASHKSSHHRQAIRRGDRGRPPHGSDLFMPYQFSVWPGKSYIMRDLPDSNGGLQRPGHRHRHPSPTPRPAESTGCLAAAVSVLIYRMWSPIRCCACQFSGQLLSVPRSVAILGRPQEHNTPPGT